jgi:ABC-type nitrate/sulfonate/bicarbonate transport system substrate-binding protein/outer membrane protein OmpA-like peptidoglycan-associated protein
MAVLVVGLGYLGFSRMSKKSGGPGGMFSDQDMAQVKGGVEAPDASSATTVKEYTFTPASKLPEVKGAAAYAPMAEGRVVRQALNVWAGWAPIVLANNGMKPGKIWTDGAGKPFKLELVLIDDPIAMRDAFAGGKIHIGWGTLDMVRLFAQGLQKDSRTMPRVYTQTDFSNGGDGIVVRSTVKSVADLRGKTCVLAQNSPSHFFLLNALINGGVQPSEVTMKFTGDAFQAAAAFNADKKLDCVVTWAPDIYNLEKIPGNKMLVSTQTANKLIADVWMVRADFAKDNAPIVEGLMRGQFAAIDSLKTEAGKARAAKLLADAYSIPETDARNMLGDAHLTNYAESRAFLMDANNPANAERIWNNADFLYRRIGALDGEKVTFDQIIDFSILDKLGKEPKFANSKDEYATTFVPTTASAVQAESNEILTKTVVVQFFPNSDDLAKTVTTPDGKEVPYDPNVGAVIEEIGKLAAQYGNARIIIEGHTDASMRGQVDPSAVKELSLRRANAVKQNLVRKFPKLQPNQFVAAGLGWDRPADPTDPGNNAKNRRVEVKVYPLEAVK